MVGLVHVHFGDFLDHGLSGIELGPFLIRVGIMERITHLRNAIRAVADVERGIVFFEMVRQRFGVSRRLRSLRVFWSELQDVFPLDFYAVTVR